MKEECTDITRTHTRDEVARSSCETVQALWST